MSARGASPASPFTPGASDDECAGLTFGSLTFAGLPGRDNLFSLDCPAFPGLEEFFATAGLDELVAMDTGAMPVLMNASDAEASADVVAPLLTPDASKHTVAGEPKRAPRQRGHKGGRMKVPPVMLTSLTFAQQTPHLTLEQVRSVQHLSLREAADECKIGTTQFKLNCRMLGITRWPYRKLKSLRNLISSCAKATDRASVEVKLQLDQWTQNLEAIQAEFLTGPVVALPESVDKFRAWNVKQMSMARKGHCSFAISTCPAPPPSCRLNA